MLSSSMEKYAISAQESMLDFIRQLAPVPAPSHDEDKRVGWVKKWMEDNGARGVFVDSAKNVIWPVRDNGTEKVAVLIAHTDVVFPDTDTLPFSEDEERMYCPGIGDDTARLALLLHAVKYFTDSGFEPGCGLIVAANSCEEGLGNCDGAKKLIETYGDRMTEFITVDWGLKSMCTVPVGSHRYRVTVTTEGGHSFGNFGNRNAIACLSGIINTLYQMKVPSKKGTRTTYNVGTIEGGTSVNTIAQNASMLYEYRSDDRECLETMKNMFERVIDAYRAMGIGIEAELLGLRPCMGDVDSEKMQALKDRIRRIGSEVLGLDDMTENQGSTDANIPLSVGIPALAIGGCVTGGTHTREEWINKKSLYDGLRFLLGVVGYYFNK